jgi:antitoxin ParD1/3/4
MPSTVAAFADRRLQLRKPAGNAHDTTRAIRYRSRNGRDTAMNVTLTQQTEALVRERVASGRYPDPEAVIEQVLRLLQERDALDELRALVAEADAEVERGEVIDWTPDLFDQLRREAAEAA